MSDQAQDDTARLPEGGSTTAAQDAADEEDADLIKSAAGESGVEEERSTDAGSTSDQRP